MSVLIYADSSNGTLTKNAFEAASYGAQVAKANGTNAVAIVTGSASGLEKLGNFGVSKVLHASDAKLDSFDAHNIAAVVAQAASTEGADVIVFPHDYAGNAIAPVLAAKLDAGLVAGALALPTGNTVRKSEF